MLKQDNGDNKRPYVLRVEERYLRDIVVWAENIFEALEKAEELHSEGEINLGCDNYAGHKIQRSSVKPTETILEILPNYGKEDEND